MVAPGMRRYKVRTEAQASLVGPEGSSPLDLPAIFGRRAPIRLEIGCGHGEFISQMAAAHPDEDFVGVEYDRLRITKGAHKCLGLGATNASFYGGMAEDFVRDRMPTASASRIYILFPDPWPKPDHRRRRLMTRAFLADLSRVAAPGCRFIFGSDTHNYTMQVLNNLTTLPGLWRNLYLPSGYRINIPTRFPTVFERYKKEEGDTIAYLMLERTDVPAPVLPAPHRPPRGSRTQQGIPGCHSGNAEST